MFGMFDIDSIRDSKIVQNWPGPHEFLCFCSQITSSRFFTQADRLIALSGYKVLSK